MVTVEEYCCLCEHFNDASPNISEPFQNPYLCDHSSAKVDLFDTCKNFDLLESIPLMDRNHQVTDKDRLANLKKRVAE